MNTLKTLFFFIGATVCFTSCKDSTTDTPVTPAPVVKLDVEFFALTDANSLVKVNAKASEMNLATVAVTGLASGEMLTSVDFRPATGELYGVSNQSRLYVINEVSGAARMIGSALTPAIDGTGVGIDFNPTVDRLRLVTNKGQNLRINPETGAVVATDGAINGVMNAMIGEVAYTNNVAGASTTLMLDLDPATDKLYKQDPPNNGTLAEIGAFGVDATMIGGFDIVHTSDVALAIVMVMNTWELHQVNTTTGKFTKLGNLPTGNYRGMAIPTAMVGYATTQTNNLLIFNTESIGFPVSKAITGLQANETILGIDMRPRNGQMYALGSSSRLYTLNLATGAATAVGTAPFTTLLSGTNFGVDFNPTVDRIRVISNTGQNLRLHPDLGTLVAVDAPLNLGTPTATATAYSNNFAGATTTIMYNIDSGTDRLVRQDPPNNGTQIDIGPLGINVEAANGFDITSKRSTAFAVLRVGNFASLYTINVMTGMASKVADFPQNNITGFSFGTGF